MNKIINPLGYYPDPTKFGTLDSGVLYIGDPDVGALNVVANQKQVSDLQENNTLVNIAQPISLSPGGIPLSADGSRYPSLFVDGDYSMLVLDALGGSQVYYIPSAKVVVYTDSATADSLTNDAFDVEGIGTLYCDTTSNNVTIGGFINGVDNQTVRIIKYDTLNSLTIENNEQVVDSQDIFLDKGADKTFNTLGGITVTYKDGVGWFESAGIAAESIVTGDIADSAVTTAKIADLNVTAAKIADNTITASQIAPSAVHTAEIIDGAVTFDKLSSNADPALNVQDRLVSVLGSFNGLLGVTPIKYLNIAIGGIVRNGVGLYTVTFESPMVDANYIITEGHSQLGTIEAPLVYTDKINFYDKTKDGFSIKTITLGGSNVLYADFAYISFAVFGTIA